MSSSGVFVDCRSHWKGRIGRAVVSFAKYQGGVASIGRDGADTGLGLEQAHLRLATRMRLVCRSEEGSADYGRSVAIRQENDPAPKFHFLEEGPVRLGMRIAFDLLDEAGHYHGDGHQDIWVYPEGDIHFTWVLRTADLAGHGQVQDCFLAVDGEKGYQTVRIGGQTIGSKGEACTVPFGERLSEKAIVLSGEASAALYWARDQGDVLKMGYDHGSLPPFYASRWPTGVQQWAQGNMGWTCGGASAAVHARMDKDGPRLNLAWLRDGAVEGDVGHAATLVVSVGEDGPELQRRIAALQQPLQPEVKSGNFRCYTEEDGTYEIGQGDPSLGEIVFPPDPLERQVRIRFYRRKTDPHHPGAVRATANGAPLPIQLMSEGELTDDICVVMEMSHRNDSVDDVIVSTKLRREEPTRVVIEKVPGIQATYQSESAGVDLQRRAGNRRDVVVWSSRNQERPIFELDLFSGAVHRWTNYGQTEPALWEMPMAWFKSCGNSRHNYCNVLKEFTIEKNGPEEVAFYLRSTNPNQRAQSELWLRMPYDHPRPRLEVRMRMEILQQWDDDNVEFSDIFPYPSRLVETWFHDAVFFMQRDKSATVYTYRPDRSVYTPGESEDDRLFYGLFATDRGNVLTLLKNPHHPEHKLHYSVCGNYIDVHVNFAAGPVPVPAGKVFEVEYITELFGDSTTGADEIKQIGRRSLEAGDIVVE